MCVLEEKTQYRYFCDMDGVIVDFMSAFRIAIAKDLPKEMQSIPDVQLYGKFRDYLRKKLKSDEEVVIRLKSYIDTEKWWANLEWTVDGQKLWDYLKTKKTKILSSPGRYSNSKVGKYSWCAEHLNLDKSDIILEYRKYKYSGENKILIDDQECNIEKWRKAGGIGILHASAADTIKQLEEKGEYYEYV